MKSNSMGCSSVFFKTYVSLAVSAIFGLLFCYVIIPFLILRRIIQRLAKLVRPDLIRLVSRNSSVWTSDSLCTSPETNITIVAVLEKKISHSHLRDDFISNVLAKYPKLKQHFEIWCGYSFWKWDQDFDIHKHLPRNTSLVNGQKALVALANQINRSPWTQESSPWSLTLVEEYHVNPHADATCALIFNIHHSLADAFAAQCILTSLGNRPPPPPANDVTPEVDAKDGAIPLVLAYLNGIYELVKDARTLKDDNRIRGFGSKSKDRDIDYLSIKAGKKVKNSIPVEIVQKIRDEAKVSSTAVMGALAGGCIQNICAQAQVRVPERTHLMLPFSTPEHSGQASNCLSFVFVNVPVGDKSFSERLELTEAELQRQRRGHFSKIFGALVPWFLGPLPTILIKYLYKVELPTGMLISINIDDTLSFRGTAVTDISFISGPLRGDQGIFIFFMKYSKNFKIGLALSTAFRTKVKLEGLLQNMADELHSFKRSISAPPAVDDSSNIASEQESSTEAT